MYCDLIFSNWGEIFNRSKYHEMGSAFCTWYTSATVNGLKIWHEIYNIYFFITANCQGLQDSQGLCSNWVSQYPSCNPQYLRTNCRLSCCQSTGGVGKSKLDLIRYPF